MEDSLKIFHLLCALALTSGIGCSTVSEPILRAQPIQWPKRLPPKEITVTKRDGSIPFENFGRFGGCSLSGFEVHSSDGNAMVMATALSRVDPTDPVAIDGTTSKLTVTENEDSFGRVALESHRGDLPNGIIVYRPSAPKGTLFLLSSMNFLTKAENKLLDAFWQRGWQTVVIMPCLDLMRLTDETEKDAANDFWGARIHSHLAERAYAAEAVWLWLSADHPELKSLPLAICGVSLGALSAPAVALRLGDVDALVMIGGGAPVPTILATSSLNLLPKAITENPHNFVARHLDSVSLDPGNVASYLNDIPMLLFDGRFDRIVPARCGDELYRALGKPERWRYPFGHLLLVNAIMPLQRGRIADWVEQAVSR
ncbi:MAG: alpha/beta hydrolase [Verrucomicrobiae bacterium]|nr:alpha/beta hydrolase [Verrucomicrobiae bacterium]